MSKLSQLSARERQQIIDDFVDGVFAGTVPEAPENPQDPEDPAAAIAHGMRQLPADLPDDPSPEQVSAWVELAELVADESFRQRARSMALAGQSSGQNTGRGSGQGSDQNTGQANSAATSPEPAQPAYADVIQHAGQAVAAGTDPGSPAGQAVLGRIVAPGTSAADRTAMLGQLETFTDARVERYWQLLAILNGQPVPPSVVPGFEWLIAALRASLDSPPSSQ